MQEASGAEFIDLNRSAPFSAAVSDTNLRLHSFPSFHLPPFFSPSSIALMRSVAFSSSRISWAPRPVRCLRFYRMPRL